MCEALRELFKDEFEEATKNGTNCGKWINLISLIIKKLNKGKALDTIAEEVEEDISVVQKICDLVKENKDATVEKLAELYCTGGIRSEE